MLSDVRPDAIVHLAAASHVHESWRFPSRTLMTNCVVSVDLYEVCADTLPPSVRFLYISSADVYGPVGQDSLPLTEKSAPCPNTPYAVSKLASEAMLRLLRRNHGGPQLLTVRPFNHIGPGQSPGFAIPSFAAQVADIAAGRREVLRHGN